MPQVGVRELKNEASEIIRTVREEQAEYVVTYRGKPVATISPILNQDVESSIDDVRPDAEFWASLDKLRAEIEANWQSEKTAVELIEEQRRQL